MQFQQIAIVFLILGATKLCAEERRFERAEREMGTRFSILLYSESVEAAEQAFSAAFGRIRQLNERLSDYRAESEVSRLSNAFPPKTRVKVSRDLWEVLSRGQRISRLSDGAFDMTLGPVTTVWRRARRRRQLPDMNRIRAALGATGFQKLKLVESDQLAELTVPEMRLDLGGIAKGFALDQAMLELKRVGIKRALIDGGGDLIASQPPPNRRGWRVGLAGLVESEAPAEFVWLSNSAIATSGDLWQFVEIDGVRYSHIIDPKTGLGLTQRSSVTVLARQAIDADAVASAVSVMGPHAGLEFLKSQPGWEARITYEEDGVASVVTTPKFAALVESALQKD